MCGVVGIWRLDGRAVDSAILIGARDQLVKRGPDDAGVWVDRDIGLGHRRLSIIDLSPAGRMPMTNETGDIHAVFNGEIYNFATLRKQLVDAGHTFKSETDSEVILHAYEQWGDNCFDRFDGMFAIALWDGKRRRLVLARDITGEKPLFYHASDKAIVFGSTLKALLAFPEVERRVDPDAVRSYLEFGYVAAPNAMIAGVRKVPAGSFVVFEAGKAPATTVYWSFERAASHRRTISLEDATDELHQILRDTVRSRLVSDVPLGAFLSGGVDSSLVVALMAEASSAVRTFTIGFREAAFDESEYAHRVAKHLGVENTTMVLSAGDVLKELPSLTDVLDEPMADYSVLPGLAVAKLARRHVTVALTGDGADEAFAGYRYYSAARLFDRVSNKLPSPVRSAISRAAVFAPGARAQRALQRVTAEDAAAYFGRSGFYRGATAGGGSASVLLPAVGRPRPDEVVAEYVRALDMSATEGGLVWDATKTLADAWLVKVDRTTMAVSLESRAPLLARRVLEFAFGLPLDYRVKGNRRKIVLRRVLARYLPTEMIERPKQGFTAPMKTWFANELKDELHTRLSRDRMARIPVVDADGVARVLGEHEAGKVDHTQLLWALFHLDSWYERNVDQASIR